MRRRRRRRKRGRGGGEGDGGGGGGGGGGGDGGGGGGFLRKTVCHRLVLYFIQLHTMNNSCKWNTIF